MPEKKHGRPSAWWVYHNSKGKAVGLVVRWDIAADPSDPQSKPSKIVLPVSLVGPGQWANVGMPEPRPIYRLPDPLAATPDQTVIIVEGEKCADAACSCGLTATTSPHGSQSAGKADRTPVKGVTW